MRDRSEFPEEQPRATRSAGLRRLSRLTWRATELSAVTAVGFATLFARAAPAQTASHDTTAPTAAPSAPAAPLTAGTPTATASPRHHKGARRAATGAQPTVQPGQAATSGQPAASAR